MPNNRKNTRSKSNRGKRRTNPLLEIQKQILASNVAQQLYPTLVVPDVARHHLKALKSFSFPSKFEIDISGTPAPQFSLFDFDIGNFPDAASFALIFDQYRVDQLQFDFYVETGPTFFTPAIATSIDYTDGVVPTTVLSVLDNDTCLVTDTSFFQRTIAPKYTMPNSTTGDTGLISSGWIPTQIGDATSPVLNDTTWNGLKLAFLSAPGNDVLVRVIVTAILNFRIRN